MSVLALDAAGTPRAWVTPKEAICYFAKNQVVWSLGDIVAGFRGGYRNDGSRSYIESPSIIAVRGSGFDLNKHGRVALSNGTLFGRDRNVCAYCGDHFANNKHLSREHIVPRSKGGPDDWMNVVTACIPCNTKKGNKTLAQAKMELLYVPYKPNHYEHLLLQGRNISADQMEYLLAGVPKHSRIHIN